MLEELQTKEFEVKRPLKRASEQCLVWSTKRLDGIRRWDHVRTALSRNVGGGANTFAGTGIGTGISTSRAGRLIWEIGRCSAMLCLACVVRRRKESKWESAVAGCLLHRRGSQAGMPRYSS